ncbi:MAG: DUF981 domain-containing protein [Thermoplasmata archaeon]
MAWLFTDPLAANLFIVGIMFFGFGAYAIYRFVMNKNNEEINRGFSYFLLGTGGYSMLYGILYSIIVPAPFTVAYGELFGDPLVFLGLVSIITGVLLLRKSSLAFLSIFSFFAGIFGITYGVDGYKLGMTSSPIVLLLMYLGAGIGGILVTPLTITNNRKVVAITAILAAIAFFGVAILTLYVGTTAIGGHLVDFKNVRA